MNLFTYFKNLMHNWAVQTVWITIVGPTRKKEEEKEEGEVGWQ